MQGWSFTININLPSVSVRKSMKFNDKYHFKIGVLKFILTFLLPNFCLSSLIWYQYSVALTYFLSHNIAEQPLKDSSNFVMRKQNLQCPTMLHLQVNSYTHISGQLKSQTGIFHEGNVVVSTYKIRESLIKFGKFLFKLNLK